MKKLTTLLLVILVALCLFACDRTGGDDTDYPDEAIALSADNLSQYFDVRVVTDVGEDYFTDHAGVHKQTKATSYVALVPRADYSAVSGSIRYKLNSGLIKGYSQDYNEFSFAVGDQTLALKRGIVNKSYDLTVTSEYTYHDNDRLNNITIISVTGYVIPGSTNEPTEADGLTDADRDASNTVRDELASAISDYSADFSEVSRFNYTPTGVYHFRSLYGTGRDKSNLANLGLGKFSADRDAGVYKRGQFTYVLRDGVLYEQSLNSAGLVNESISGVTLDELNAIGPYFDGLLDESAVYVKRENGAGGTDYLAYTTLYEMKNPTVREYFEEHLKNYGITSHWDKFTVKYTYSFTDGGFLFDATVTYQSDRYPVEYTDVRVSYGYKLADVGTATVTPYVAGRDAFALQDNLADAMRLGTGAVRLSRGQDSFCFTTYSTAYEGYGNTNVENYMPLIIEDGGVYTFTPSMKYITMYDADGRQIYPQDDVYYPAGTYYLCAESVLYGKNQIRVDVSANYFEDYGSTDAPTELVGEADILFEGKGDRIVLSFTPDTDGIWSIGEFTDVAMQVDLSGDGTDICYVYEGEYCLNLVGGREYILILDYRGDGESVSMTASPRFIASPMDYGELTLTTEWQDVVIWGEGEGRIPVSVDGPGEYFVEFEWQAGQDLSGGSFYTLDGKLWNSYRYIDLEGGEQMKLTQLFAGEYLYDVPLYMNRYFVGRVRLVTYTEGVTEERSITLPTDEYLTVETSELPTLFSTSSFTFTVDSAAKLLVTVDSDFFTLYDKDGKRISITVYPTYVDTDHGVEAKYTALLTPGEYTAVFEIDEYSTPGVKTASLRLLTA